MLLQHLLSRLKHEHYGLSHTAMLLPVIGAFLSISLIVLTSQHLVADTGYPILIASMGASAVLLFVVPSSPMAQIWPFVGGHLISAVIGITCFYLMPDLFLAAAVAVSLSILVMIYLGCLHPPGGAASLAFILGGPQIHELGFQFLITPVVINVTIMLVVSQAFNNARFLIKRRPKVQGVVTLDPKNKNTSRAALPFTEPDLDEALKDMDTYIDISHEDLKTIFSLALTRAHMRTHINNTCKDIMSPALFTTEFGSTLAEAWHIMQANNLHGLTVVDRTNHVIGIITATDFLEHSESLDGETPEARVENLIALSGLLESSKPEAVGQIMSSPVTTVGINDPVSSVMPIFKRYEAHILPVVDEQNILHGLITITDL